MCEECKNLDAVVPYQLLGADDAIAYQMEEYGCDFELFKQFSTQ